MQETNKNTQENVDKTVNVKSVNKKVDNLVSVVDKLANSVDSIVKKLEEKPEVDVKPIFRSPDAIPPTYTPKGYVPPKYRQIVDEVLSSEFGFDVKENVDNMDFEIQIIVPERFSSLTLLEKQAGMQDIRSRVISRALGENGVREWCIKVRENLNKFYSKSGVQSPFISNSVI